MGTKYKGTSREQLVLDAFIKLLRASHSIPARQNNKLSNVGLTNGQFGVLEAIYHLGPLNQRTLGKKILTSEGNITFIIDNLVKKELVTRRQDPEDRRRSIIELTDKGREFITEYFPIHLNNIKKEFEHFSDEELLELARLTKKAGLSYTEEDNNL